MSAIRVHTPNNSPYYGVYLDSDKVYTFGYTDGDFGGDHSGNSTRNSIIYVINNDGTDI